MGPGSLRKDAQGTVGVVIVTGSCCIPGMAPFDDQARQVVEQAIAQTGVAAQLRMVSAATAYFGGLPRAVMAQIIGLSQTGQMPLPAVLVNGKVVSFGVPRVEDITSALLQTAHTENSKEKHHNE